MEGVIETGDLKESADAAGGAGQDEINVASRAVGAELNEQSESRRIEEADLAQIDDQPLQTIGIQQSLRHGCEPAHRVRVHISSERENCGRHVLALGHCRSSPCAFALVIPNSLPTTRPAIPHLPTLSCNSADAHPLRQRRRRIITHLCRSGPPSSARACGTAPTVHGRDPPGLCRRRMSMPRSSGSSGFARAAASHRRYW